MYTKAETASPTVSLEASMMSLMIDALEEKDVATADVGGAFLHREMKDLLLLKVTGDSVDIMCKKKPGYEEYITMEKRKEGLIFATLEGTIRMREISSNLV